jgi:hypothetical protein
MSAASIATRFKKGLRWDGTPAQGRQKRKPKPGKNSWNVRPCLECGIRFDAARQNWCGRRRATFNSCAKGLLAAKCERKLAYYCWSKITRKEYADAAQQAGDGRRPQDPVLEHEDHGGLGDGGGRGERRSDR